MTSNMQIIGLHFTLYFIQFLMNFFLKFCETVEQTFSPHISKNLIFNFQHYKNILNFFMTFFFMPKSKQNKKLEHFVQNRLSRLYILLFCLQCMMEKL